MAGFQDRTATQISCIYMKTSFKKRKQGEQMTFWYKKKIPTHVLFNMQNTHPHSLKYKNQTDDSVCDSPSLVFRRSGSPGHLSIEQALQSVRSLVPFKSLPRLCCLHQLPASAWISLSISKYQQLKKSFSSWNLDLNNQRETYRYCRWQHWEADGPEPRDFPSQALPST